MLFFFFSSRRRHTRSDRDWSSDVCSSDLIGALFLAQFAYNCLATNLNNINIFQYFLAHFIIIIIINQRRKEIAIPFLCSNEKHQNVYKRLKSYEHSCKWSERWRFGVILSRL